MIALDNRTIEHVFSAHFEPLRLRGRSDDTRRLYRNTFTWFGRFLGRVPTLDDLDDHTVTRFLDWFRRMGRSPHTVARERTNLLAFWRWCCRQRDQHGKRLIEDWPNVEEEVLPEDEPMAWTRDDLGRLFHAIENAQGNIGGVPADQWWYALHCVLWDTGERIGAVLRSTWDNCCLETRWLTIPAVHRKGKRRGRSYQLHEDTIAALKAIREYSGKAVFPWPYCRSYIWERYKRLLESAGLPTNRASKFHRMRKSVASWAEAAGFDATRLLGHRERRTTQRYLDPRIVKPPQASEILFRPNTPPPGRDVTKPREWPGRDLRTG